jgi:hypothetical protein
MPALHHMGPDDQRKVLGGFPLARRRGWLTDWDRPQGLGDERQLASPRFADE